MSILGVIILATMGEAVWETLKMVWQNGKFSYDKVGALAVSIMLALGTGIDIFPLINIPTKIPYLGMILTGVLISRGASFMHDLLSIADNMQQSTKIKS